MESIIRSSNGRLSTLVGVVQFIALLALSMIADNVRAECPCNIDPLLICESGDCSELPAFNYLELFEELHDYADTEGASGDGRISCGNNFSDITAVAGIRRGPYPGSLTVRAELDRCLVMQTYDDENGVLRRNYYSVDIEREADAAKCLASVHRVCSDAVRP